MYILALDGWYIFQFFLAGTDVWFSKSARSWGYADMMKLSELHDKTKGFLFKDRLIVETKISAIGIQK